LPSETRVRQQFVDHRAEFDRFVTLLARNGISSYTVIGSDGTVESGAHGGLHARAVPEYRRLEQAIGAKLVTVGDDGSVEFALWGSGCAIRSDSYMGIVHVPRDHPEARPGLAPTVVPSLESDRLPQENGDVETGLYLVPIEPEWYVYRYEYQE